jgi:hypothetical protein
MTNPTSNFGWQMPTPTDLVTDLPADFEVFGQAVDTTLADLKGGTSGQVLAKASATDMDFTWTTPEIGDITAITVTAPITGGGTTGSVGIAVSAASTAASGVVQLSDSTSTTSSVLASTPTATKSAYDLAAAAIPKSTVTTNGDLIYGTGSATVTRRAIGTTGQVLTVSGGVPTWATPSTSGFVGCGLYRSGVGTIPNATATIIDWNSERFDTNAFHDTATNNTRITIPSGYAGKYLITWQWGYNSNTNGYRETYLLLNGAMFPQSYNLVTFPGYSTQSSALVYSLSVGDYIQLQTTQNSGGSLDASNTQAFFNVVYLGA